MPKAALNTYIVQNKIDTKSNKFKFILFHIEFSIPCFASITFRTPVPISGYSICRSTEAKQNILDFDGEPKQTDYVYVDSDIDISCCQTSNKQICIPL
jgi:hypothetical protein